MYVPAPGRDLGIDPGSAIVGEPRGEGMILVYFEGDRFGAMKDGDEMFLHAADRLSVHYPTVARRWVTTGDLVLVGYYDYPGGTVDPIEDPAAFAAWRTQHPRHKEV